MRFPPRVPRLLGTALLGAMIALAGTVRADTAWLEALMQRMAAVPARKADFAQEKRLAALKQPLLSRGQLVYRRPSYLEMITTYPRAETLAVDGDQVSIVAANGVNQTLSLASAPAVAGLVDGIRMALAGDLPRLRQLYHVAAEGDPKGWRLVLTPAEPQLAQLLRSVTISGTGTDVHTIGTVGTNGDEQTITITDTR